MPGVGTSKKVIRSSLVAVPHHPRNNVPVRIATDFRLAHVEHCALPVAAAVSGCPTTTARSNVRPPKSSPPKLGSDDRRRCLGVFMRVALRFASKGSREIQLCSRCTELLHSFRLFFSSLKGLCPSLAGVDVVVTASAVL